MRILFECGKRPLYSISDSNDELNISIVQKPQVEPDCLLCGKKQDSFQSAQVLKEQMADVGVDFPILKLESLSENSLDEKQKIIRMHSIQHALQSLEEKGCQHVIIVADRTKLNYIYQSLTKEKLPEQENENICLWAIRDGKPAYVYNPQRVDLITEGLLDSKLVSQINGENCPESLKKFHGKVKKPIDGYALLYKLQQQKKA